MTERSCEDDRTLENRSTNVSPARSRRSRSAPFLNSPAITYFSDGAGGTTNLIFDARRGSWGRAWSSPAGTVRNCAGGVTPWGSWVTCEETGAIGHGWSFEVGPIQGDPTRLKDMGRFSHEALMLDPRTGFVYQTEDAGGNSGFYRFVPNERGRLVRGGRLYMLAAKGSPNIFLGAAYPPGTTWNVARNLQLPRSHRRALVAPPRVSTVAIVPFVLHLRRGPTPGAN